MKNYLPKLTTSLMALMLLFSIGSLANDGHKDVVEVANLYELRQQEVGDGTVYLITGEVVITHLQQAYRGQIYIQDDSGAVMIDDPNNVIETPYELYDGITDLSGTLSVFQNMLQLIPVEDPGEPSSHDNEIVPLELTLEDLTEDHQAMLVSLKDVSFDEDNPETFTHNESYYIFDDTGDGVIRTPNSAGLLDYFGAQVPDTPIDIIAVVHQRLEVTRIQPRSIADMGYTDMHNIAALRNQEPDGETVYTLISEAILTYQEDWRNSKYIEDETAGILIDDSPGIITTQYDIYDGITGIQGTLSVFGNMLQFVPQEDPGAATSSNNVIEPLVITMEEFVNNFMDYQARLITIENVYFADPEGNFVNGTVYDFTDGDIVAEFRTTFYGVDYIGDPIPEVLLNLTGLPNSRAQGDFLTSRNWGDIETLTYYSVTFEIMDEDENPIEDAMLVFRGDTLVSAPYFIEEVPVGTHHYVASRDGYHSASGNVSVTDSDLIHPIIMVAVDEDMITEFPWFEAFDDEEFPPAGWSHYALGDAGGWELADGQAYHDYTDQGEAADSWLVTPQIFLSEDEHLLLTFLQRNQFMTDYGYSGVMVSTGSGNPVHEQFVELYESDSNIGIADPHEAMVDLADYAGKVIYLAFVYQGEYAHRWWVDDVMIDYAPEAIEVPDIATLRQQPMGDLAYRITGEVVITHLQQAYRGQLYIQDETGAILIDDPSGIIETPYGLYDGITYLTGTLTQFQDMLQLIPTEDPGEPTSHDNEVIPYEVTLADLNPDIQGWLVVVRGVSFYEDNPETFTHNESYYIYDDTADGEIRTPNWEGLLDYFGEPVPDTPKDLIGVLHQRFNVVRLQPRMLADFMDPDPSDVPLTEASGIKAYPNPANTRLTLESEGLHIEQVRIYSLSGQMVMQVNTASSDHIQLDVKGLNTGMYIIQAISGNDVRSLKLQITR